MAEELTPGYYQGQERQRGIKTGRVAPRDAVRPSAWANIQNDNQLQPHHKNQVWSETSGGYDPNQGALFDVSKVAPRSSQTDESRAREVGAPTGRIAVKGKDTMGLAAQPGFMPNLNTKQKKAALTNVADARNSQGTSRGGGHFAEIMEDRDSTYNAAGHADWYEGTNSAGTHDGSIGHAPAMIQQAAGRRGVKTTVLTRAVAQTSPQAGWQDANTGTFDNLNGAKAAVNSVSRMTASKRTPDPTDDQVRGRASAIHAPGGVLPENMGKAAVHFFRHGDSAGSAYPVQSATSQKAPNFEASLHLSHIDPAVRRIASQAYTVDRHDARIAGMDGNSKEFQRRGVYDAVAMTGRRAALKHGQLPPNEQAAEWVGQKSRSAATLVDAPRLFDPANPPKGSRTSQRDDRSEEAKRLGIEF